MTFKGHSRSKPYLIQHLTIYTA